jgi:hypothetical protein
MSSMKIHFSFPESFEDGSDVKPYALMRDHVLPALEDRRGKLESMYAQVMGRPEVDPVLLAGVTILQAMNRLPDRAAVAACLYDARWRMALKLPAEWTPFHPTTLVYFRSRLAEHSAGKIALEAGLEAMRRTGYLKGKRAVRVDSTHMLGLVADMSRLECVRETLRLALNFLAAFGGPEAWEPWHSRYAERNDPDLRGASVERLRSTMARAGTDARDVLERAATMGAAVVDSRPVALLARVFDEQFEIGGDGAPAQRKAALANAVQNPHDPEAVWCTKGSLGKKGWVGYKAQVCETAPEKPRRSGEPTEAVITAIVTQSATASDNGSLSVALDAHTANGEAVPETAFTDAGYINAHELAKADASGYELCGPVGAPPHSGSRFGTDAFRVDIPNRTALCPAGKRSSECSRIHETGRSTPQYYFAWSQTDCSACPLASQCLSTRKLSPRRSIQVGELHMLLQDRRDLCKTADYKIRMRRRNGIEGTNSEIKRGYGARRSRYRGRAKTDVQMQFVGAACNLRRWAVRSVWLSKENR